MGATSLAARRARAGAVLLAIGWASACGTEAVGIDVCKQVEEARCRSAEKCGVTLEPPYSTTGNTVDACVRYYDVACLHGLANGYDPGPNPLHACVAAIEAHPCTGGKNLVLHPESDPACAWLVPPAVALQEDAGTAASEASPDGAATLPDAADAAMGSGLE